VVGWIRNSLIDTPSDERMIVSLGASGDFVGKGRGGVDHGERPQRLGCEEDGEGCFVVRFPRSIPFFFAVLWVID
jgi:hypothetical protein